MPRRHPTGIAYPLESGTSNHSDSGSKKLFDAVMFLSHEVGKVSCAGTRPVFQLTETLEEV